MDKKLVDVHRVQQSHEDQKVLDWLTPIEFGPQHSDILNRRQPGTGQWFLDSENCKIWLETHNQILFCPGIPGAGKTMLTSIVIGKLDQTFGSDQTVGISYVYCNFRRKDEQRVDQLVASLLKQLARQQASLPEQVRSLYQKHGRNSTRPSLEELTGALQSVATMYQRVFVAIDALDECQTEDDCRSRFLTAIFDLQAKTGASIFATSRINPDIGARFQGHLQQEIEATTEDVSAYLEGKMAHFPNFIQHNLELQKDIWTAIIQSVGGM